MTAPTEHGVRLARAADVSDWFRPGELEMAVGDALDASNSAPDGMSVGFARWRAGTANRWVVNYDEALIVLRGRMSVETDQLTVAAGPGEVIYLPAGTELVYWAIEDAEVVYVTHPHWFDATQRSEHAAMLDEYQPVDAGWAAELLQ
jgi:ethanolamine utilization protein EutQ